MFSLNSRYHDAALTALTTLAQAHQVLWATARYVGEHPDAYSRSLYGQLIKKLTAYQTAEPKLLEQITQAFAVMDVLSGLSDRYDLDEPLTDSFIRGLRLDLPVGYETLQQLEASVQNSRDALDAVLRWLTSASSYLKKRTGHYPRGAYSALSLSTRRSREQTDRATNALLGAIDRLISEQNDHRPRHRAGHWQAATRHLPPSSRPPSSRPPSSRPPSSRPPSSRPPRRTSSRPPSSRPRSTIRSLSR